MNEIILSPLIITVAFTAQSNLAIYVGYYNEVNDYLIIICPREIIR